jgi:hypothetical protein
MHHGAPANGQHRAKHDVIIRSTMRRTLLRSVHLLLVPFLLGTSARTVAIAGMVTHPLCALCAGIQM